MALLTRAPLATAAAGRAGSSSSSSASSACRPCVCICRAAKGGAQPDAAAASTSGAAPAAAEAAALQQPAAAPVQREFRALGSRVVESNTEFKGPEDQADFWEGDRFEALGKFLENYFLPGLIALGIICGALAAKTYDEGATAFIKSPTGPDAEPSLIIATPEGS